MLMVNHVGEKNTKKENKTGAKAIVVLQNPSKKAACHEASPELIIANELTMK